MRHFVEFTQQEDEKTVVVCVEEICYIVDFLDGSKVMFNNGDSVKVKGGPLELVARIKHVPAREDKT